MTKCCVIGGAGFIGSHLVVELINSGREVSVIGRRELSILEGYANVEYLQGDINNRDFLMKSLRGIDEVIDLAYSSVPKTSFDNPILDIKDNLPSAVALFDALSELAIKKTIFVSSGGTVYGEPTELPILETYPTNPVSPYGITKLALEKYAYMYFKLKKLPVVCVRPSNPYGEGQKAFVGQGFVATAIASIINGQEINVFGECGTIRDYIYVKDLAKGLVAALDHGVPGEIYNIGTGVGRSNLDVIRQIEVSANKHHLTTKIRSMPERPFDVSANVLDSSKLMAISEWSPSVSFADGIEQTWQWIWNGD